jgi:hypothetical protein
MRCDAQQQQQEQQQNARERERERERENERASSERRGESQRLDSGLNVDSAIRLGGNPKMPFRASLIDRLGRTGFFVL